MFYSKVSKNHNFQRTQYLIFTCPCIYIYKLITQLVFILLIYNLNVLLTAATGTRISTNRPARACLISLSFTSRKYCAHSCINWNEASNSSIGTIYIKKKHTAIKNFIVKLHFICMCTHTCFHVFYRSVS